MTTDVLYLYVKVSQKKLYLKISHISYTFTLFMCTAVADYDSASYLDFLYSYTVMCNSHGKRVEFVPQNTNFHSFKHIL